MTYAVWINLWWTDNSENILQQYFHWIDLCSKHEIKTIRIFSVRWSINALFEENGLELFLRIIEYAAESGISVIPVLAHFTDFIDRHERDLEDDSYTWRSFPLKKKNIADFFREPDTQFLAALYRVLDRLESCANISTIELFNEIDLVPVSQRRLSCWVAGLAVFLQRRYAGRFDYVLSLADERNYQRFENVLSELPYIKIDLHNYWIPSEFAFENFEKLQKKYWDSLSFCEYWKYSHQSNLDHPAALQYFASGLCWGMFSWREVSPFHWWWNELLERAKYLQVINTIHSISPEALSSAPCGGYEIKIIHDNSDGSVTGRSPNFEKIFERWGHLLRNPFRIAQEFWAIVKLFRILFHKIFNRTILFHRWFRNKHTRFVYLETIPAKTIHMDLHLNHPYGAVTVLNVLTGEKNMIEIVDSHLYFSVTGIFILTFHADNER